MDMITRTLIALMSAGFSVWLDYLTRSLVGTARASLDVFMDEWHAVDLTDAEAIDRHAVHAAPALASIDSILRWAEILMNLIVWVRARACIGQPVRYARRPELRYSHTATSAVALYARLDAILRALDDIPARTARLAAKWRRAAHTPAWRAPPANVSPVPAHTTQVPAGQHANTIAPTWRSLALATGPPYSLLPTSHSRLAAPISEVASACLPPG